MSEQPNQLTKLNERLDIDFALRAAGLGIWEFDPVSNQIRWDEQCRALFGLAADNRMSYEEAFKYIHPDDVARVDQAAQWVMNPQSDGIFDQTYRTIGIDDSQLRWVRFQGKVSFTLEGQVNRFAGVAQDVTPQIVYQQALEETRQQVLRQFEQSPVGIATISGDELIFRSANPFYGELVGRLPEQLIGKSLLEALPELQGQGFDGLLRQVMVTNTPFTAEEVAVALNRSGQLETIYVDLAYQPQSTLLGHSPDILVIATDVTSQVLSRRKIEDSEVRFRSLVEEAPVATCLFVGRDLQIAIANEAMLSFWGKGNSVLGKPLAQAVPELVGQPFLAILDGVFTTGQTYTAYGMQAELVVNGLASTYYFDFTYKPLRNMAGEVYAIMNMATNVTQQVLARQALEASEAHLHLLENAVPALIFYLDAQQRYQSYNDAFMHWFGVNATEAIGRTVREFLGEVAYQKALPHLTIAYAGQQERYEVRSPSRMGENRWLDVTYTPHRTEAGNVLGLIVHAADITSNKQVELELRKREAALRNAVELAELGTWTLDIASGSTQLSPRHAEMFGLTTTFIPYELGLSIVHRDDRGRVRVAFEQALQPGSSGQYQAEYRIINAQSGKLQFIRAKGETSFDPKGKPMTISGTTQDVTLERELQTLLEQQVQERTEELDAANEELTASNEELLTSHQEMARTNGQLNEFNHLLSRSNENLQQFAYIASHDLQEPLRKIQSFGQLLRDQHGENLGEGVDYLRRMQDAAGRMATLIQDLLAYSRIATQQENKVPVLLNSVVREVLLDLDLLIDETKAVIVIDPLPTVRGDAMQLKQLFRNLLSNALKFRQVTTVPQIWLNYRLVPANALPPATNVVRLADAYHQIDVIDNGIGFEQKYVNRIFQVFQRLHGKNHYAGTGIGLAICEKVAANHGGAITASSQLGKGATFSVYLPT